VDDAALQRYIAELSHLIASGQLQLARDRFNEIEKPTYQNISLPTSIASNTGMLPSDYIGGYGGRASWDALTGAANMAGQFGDDPRLRAMGINPGDFTLAGRSLNLQGDQIRGQERDQELDRILQGDTQRAFERNQELERIQAIADSDFKKSMESGGRFIGGNPAPPWLQPQDEEWARQWMIQHNGFLPTEADLNQALAKYGQTSTNRTAAGSQQTMTMGPGDQSYQTTGARVGQALPTYQGPAGAATAGAFQSGAPRSTAQRQLEEQGRQADLQNQLGINAQRITEEENKRQNAIATGQLDLAREAEANKARFEGERVGLETQRVNLEQEIQRGQLDLQRGIAVGNVGGVDTLEKGALVGRIGDQATVERERMYGGAAYVDAGSTLEREAQENKTALDYLNLLNQTRGPEDAFQHLKVLNSTPGGMRDLVDAAAGRYQMGRFGGGDPSALTPATVGGLSMTGPSSPLSLPVYRGPGSGVPVGPSQWAPENIAKMDDYQKKMLLAEAESRGHDPNAAMASFKATLPTYSGPRRTASTISRRY
jgi:hypothetical protein